MQVTIKLDLDKIVRKSKKYRKIILVPRLGTIKEQSVVSKLVSTSSKLSRKGRLIMAFEMTNTQQVDLTIAPKNRLGKPAKLDGVPLWQTDNADILTITASTDGLTCSIVASGMVGVANVQVTGDADLGTGVSPIIGTVEVTVTPGAAVTVDITPGTPTEQP